MALTAQERKALVRGWVWTYWGRPPTVAEQKQYADMAEANVDLALAAVTDHPNHEKFRTKRGW